MKQLFLTMTLTLKITLGSWVLMSMPQAFANSIIDIDSTEMKIYMHPTPVLEITLQDLETDGGILYLSLIYDGAKTKGEISEIEIHNPGYEVIALTANQNGSASLEISNILQQEVPTRQQQLGPQINTQIRLSTEQMKKLKAIKDLGQQVVITIPAQTNYGINQVMERFEAPSDFCETIPLKNVEDLISNFSKLKKPEEIKYQQTFDSLKQKALRQCYIVESSKISTFSDLISLKVKIKQVDNLFGETVVRKNLTKSFSILPILKIETL